MPIAINKPAPPFCLLDQNNTKHCLKDYLGQWLLIYFYPKDDTPGCTTEACNLRDHWVDLVQDAIAVVGISTDSIKSHAKFVDKYELPFTLLADVEKTVVKQYDVWAEKKFMNKTYWGTNRTSFLIDPQGKIAKIYHQVKPHEHASQVLTDWAIIKNKYLTKTTKK